METRVLGPIESAFVLLAIFILDRLGFLHRAGVR